LAEAVEEAVSEAFRRHYQVEMPVKTRLEPSGRFTIMGAKTVVETVADPLTEIAQSDPQARAYGLGDQVYVQVATSSVGNTYGELTDEFGRVAALLAKQIIRQRIREAERRQIYEEFKGHEGEMVHGKVQRVRNGNLIVEIGRTEAILPRRELPPREKFKENDRIKAVITEVRLGPKGPQIVISRAHPWMVQRLFEMEISEVFDKTVEVKAIAREAGFRTKVAVSSRDQNVDPVGACVGQKGVRVQTVVKELGGEKIDIVHWDAEPTIFIRNSLSPAECERVIIHEDRHTAEVIVPEDHLSLAIGKEGQNARLAARLTGWKIDIRGAGEASRAEVEELIRVTFGSTPAEILASLGIGAETAPAFEAAGLTDVEKVAMAESDQLASLVGAEAGGILKETALQKWADLQSRLAETLEDGRVGRRRPPKTKHKP
jgi:transcription termination/antitermination protein NusA